MWTRVCVSHRLCPLDGGDADQTGKSSRLKQVTDVLTSSGQTCCITTWTQRHREMFYQDSCNEKPVLWYTEKTKKEYLEICTVVTCLVSVGGEGRCQDLPCLSIPMVNIFIIVVVIVFIRGGADMALHQSLSSSLVGLSDLLELGLDRHSCGSQ